MPTIDVIYEDNHLIVVNKACGEITQGDRTGDPTLPDKIKTWLAEKYNKPGNVFLGVIHRLDRPTSGLVIFAKTSKALARMNALFKERNIQKTYWAIVESQPHHKEGELIDLLKKNKDKNKSFVTTASSNDAKKAILNYRLLAKSDHYFLLEVCPKTGRHHQIRTQLSHIGCCIKGDVKYGARRSNPDRGISLHARKISFTHPIKEKSLTILAKVPNDPLWQFFEKKLEEA